MTKSRMNPKVDVYLSQAKQWRQEMTKLRRISLDCQLAEELKWGKPCYSFQKTNIVIVIPFKDSCALMFCKGALLKDANGILIPPTENTQAGRWIKFTSLREITGMETVLKAYIQEAIEVEKAGLKVNFKTTAGMAFPAELQNKLDDNPAFRAAFNALTPGRQRGYILYFSAAKQSKTREARVAKYMPQILNGKGLDD
jgi:uncharacterized protein YdeI (YjbR/CyaY-like superfamily)